MITGQQLFEKIQSVKMQNGFCFFTLEKCEELAPIVNEIEALKKEKNAVILAHSYVSPEIIYSVADFSGDSYGLSLDAKNTDADIIVFSAVKFMAETAKLLSPQKQVLIPNQLNGCSLADSITGEQVRDLKKQYPDYTFVCYINTTADVKAECETSVTSSNVFDIVEKLENDKIYFLPDKLMGLNLIEELKERGVKKDIKLWDGVCYVHEKYESEMITYLKQFHPHIKILAHPECNTDVIKHSDFVGSTAQMMNYVKTSKENTFFLLTECGLTSRLQVEAPNKTFVGSCTLCKYMKDNTLSDILRVLKNPTPEDIVDVPKEIQGKALQNIKKMLTLTK